MNVKKWLLFREGEGEERRGEEETYAIVLYFKWSSRACQQCQVKGECFENKVNVTDSVKCCDFTETFSFSLSVIVLNTLTAHHHFLSFSVFYCKSFVTAFCQFWPLCLLSHLSLICFSFLSSAMSPPACLQPITLFHSLTIVVLATLTDVHAPLLSLLSVFVVLSWVKVACHYRWRHGSDKGQKLRQKC